MAYNAVSQTEIDALSDDEDSQSLRSQSPIVNELYIDAAKMRCRETTATRTTTNPDSATISARVGAMVQSITSSSSLQSYELVEADDVPQDGDSRDARGPTTQAAMAVGSMRRQPANAAPELTHREQYRDNTSANPHPRSQRVPAQQDERDFHAAKSSSESYGEKKSIRELQTSCAPITSPSYSTARPTKLIVRTASGRPIALRHPTPDLHTLQGAYVSNIEHLEKTAERLSMTSSIEDAIREMHDEQKRADSRRSSLLTSPVEGASLSRQFSNPNSIVELNNAARSGGYSPGGFQMISSQPATAASSAVPPRRSVSKSSSRFGSRPEPEREGRPLEHFGIGSPTHTFSTMPKSPSSSRPPAAPEASETSPSTSRLPSREYEVQSIPEHEVPYQEVELAQEIPQDHHYDGRQYDGPQIPQSPAASMHTMNKDEEAWENFDGVHCAPSVRYAPSYRSLSGESAGIPGNDAAVPTEGDATPPLLTRAPLPRPKSYADPETGQQMVYYPAPVPVVLNLPPKLSSKPPAALRDQRRSQILSSIPQAQAQRQSWLPEVLEGGVLSESEPVQDVMDKRKSVAQSMQGLNSLPPQLRASAFFEHPSQAQTVELTGDSAVATLDSILDASAHAPVSAFTDHAFAGHLGAEVYGKSDLRASKTKSQIMASPPSEKRSSSFNWLGKRSSSGNMKTEDEKRRSTMPGAMGGQAIAEESDDESSEGSILRLPNDPRYQAPPGDDEGEDPTLDEFQEETYEGPPTTLLAELQLRKQQQKQRTRPIAQAYPNGMHSTLVQLDTVAQIEAQSRRQKRINLAWEVPADHGANQNSDDDDEVPLGMLYAAKLETKERNRPLGLMEQRELEENEPLSRRRERLQGRPTEARRTSSMLRIPPTNDEPDENEGETLGQRMRRIRDEKAAASGLPAGRSVSGDFASELLSQFGGGDLLETGESKEPTAKSTTPDAEETLGQRRKRLQAEKEAREADPTAPAPQVTKRRSMADLLSRHPSGNHLSTVNSSGKAGGLLAEHDRRAAKRASTMSGMIGQAERPNNRRSTSQNLGPFQGDTYPGAAANPRDSNLNMQLGSYAQQRQMMMGMNMGMGMGFPQQNGFGMGINMNMNMNGMSGMGMGMGMGAMNTNVQPNIWPQQQAMYAPAGYAPHNAYNHPMNTTGAMGMGYAPAMATGQQPGQLERVERWRQSVMQ